MRKRLHMGKAIGDMTFFSFRRADRLHKTCADVEIPSEADGHARTSNPRLSSRKSTAINTEQNQCKSIETNVKSMQFNRNSLTTRKH